MLGIKLCAQRAH